MKDKINNDLFVSYAKTVYGQDEIDAVVKCLNESTQMGNYARQFEAKIAKLFDKKHCLYVNSGSSALYIGVEAFGFKKGSEVITPALTFGTSVGCIVKNNLVPVFVDIEPNTFNIDVTKIESMVSDKTVAILAPNLMGNICRWDKIREIADKYDLIVIEDSADTLGATYKNKSSGFYSDMSITSFYGSHIINGAGNGGIIVTSDDQIADKCKLLRSWGRSSSLFVESEAIENRFDIHLDGIQYDAKFVFEEPGYQLEPSEISAAFALVQLGKLDQNMSLRNKHFRAHSNFFAQYPDFFTLPIQNPNAHTCWLAYPMVINEDAPFSRTDLQIFLEKRNIQTRVVFTGNILRQPMMKNVNYVGNADDYVNADRIMKQGILLACHHGLTDEMIEHLYSSIKIFIDSHS